MNALKLDEL